MLFQMIQALKTKAATDLVYDLNVPFHPLIITQGLRFSSQWGSAHSLVQQPRAVSYIFPD